MRRPERSSDAPMYWVNLFREDYNCVSEKDEKRRVDLPNESANCSIGGKGVYQPSERELAEAVAILVECGAVRVEQY